MQEEQGTLTGSEFRRMFSEHVERCLYTENNLSEDRTLETLSVLALIAHKLIEKEISLLHIDASFIGLGIDSNRLNHVHVEIECCEGHVKAMREELEDVKKNPERRGPVTELVNDVLMKIGKKA